MKKDNISLSLILFGIICAEIGNAFLTYNWMPGVFRHWHDQSYSYNEFFDCVGEIILKICLLISARIYIKNRFVKIVANCYLEALLIDLIYSAFYNPFVYHLGKIELIGLTALVYIIQVILIKLFTKLRSLVV
jgi:hypothetical protein